MESNNRKCSIKKGEITLCKELYHATTNLDTKLERANMVQMNDLQRDYIGAITFRYGRKKYDIIAISFCPICGGELR